MIKRWLFFVVCCFAVTSAHAEWEPADSPLMTRWAKDVSPDKVHPEYPRPQMVRDDWQSLNGLWDFAILPRNVEKPKEFDGQILVPFPVESALSGVGKQVGPDNRLWYSRKFKLSEPKKDARWLLHFGAVDWETTAWVNGKQVGQHRGGYDPFTFDISNAIESNSGSSEHELVIAVYDPSDAGTQPRGKQVRKPHGIWYTPTTGIWQTVWLEAVPTPAYIKSLKIVPDIDQQLVRITAECEGKLDGLRVKLVVRDGDRELPIGDRNGTAQDGNPGEPIDVKIADPKLWSPDKPFLYDIEVSLTDDRRQARQTAVDQVDSYFGMRKIALGKDEQGVVRLMLNNKPLFQYGLLDQGFWPDGLYTAPTDEALRYDIEITKQLGFNMARKHVKVEPARWYYHCDRLGLLVWQDMPSGDRSIGPKSQDLQRTKESAEQYELELTRMIDAFGNYPSIVMWVPFNEGWGQFDTQRIAELVKAKDPTRLVNSASGWTDRGVGDVYDVHVYPGPGMPPVEENRAAVLGEFGGLGLPIEGHTWQDRDNWGYRSFKTREALNAAYLNLMTALRPLIGKGLAAAVYTQTTDVEIEVNGLLTYDRAVLKLNEKQILDAHRRLYMPPPQQREILPASRVKPQTWRFTISKPGEGWQKRGFNDDEWSEGPGGFGQPDTPGAIVRTQWKTPDIWLRQTFEVSDPRLEAPMLYIHHDEDARVFINGQLVAELTGYTVDYGLVPLDGSHRNLLRKGKNVIAVHCHQTGGGQYIDVGLVDLIEQPVSE